MKNIAPIAMRIALVLLILCVIVLFIVDYGTAEWVVLLISAVLNAVFFIVMLFVNRR